MEGQLYDAERQALFRWIKTYKPNLVFEVGTWKGGGSTYFISKALQENGNGRLITCEPDPELFNISNQLYSNNNIVTVLMDYSHNVINMLISNNTIPDFVFFDGPNDPDVTLSDFKLIAPHMQKGSFFSCHDWDPVQHTDGTEIIEAVKAKLLRPHINSHPDWKLVEYLTDPVSVGLVLYEKIN